MLKILKNLSAKEVGMAIVIIGLVCVQIWFDLTLPDFMNEITGLLQTGGDISEILVSGGKMLGCALGSLSMSVIVAIMSARIASGLSYSLRNRVFGKVMSFSMEEINQFSTSSLITRSTNDITQVQLFIVLGLQMLIKAPITAVWAITKIANKNFSWTVVTVIAVIVLLCIVVTCVSLTTTRFRRLQKQIDDINRVTKENLDGLSVVRAYNAEDYQERKFEKANNNLTQTNMFTSRTMSFLAPSMQMISSGLILAIYLVGAVMIDSAGLMDKVDLVSDMVVFMAYAMQVVLSFMMLSMVFMILPRATVSAKRINELLSTVNKLTPGNASAGLDEKNGEVEFRNVSFKYPDADDYVLKNINFSAKRGETVAIIGAIGSGKSTALNLIPRFYDVTEGEVLVNGRNVKEYSKDQLNDYIGYVSQRPILFKGSIKSNVVYGLEESDEKLDEALAISQASEFVKELEDGADSFVAQGGANLSGGQKQRVSIARALYKNPDIYIFDDSFSALDYKTDYKLRSALSEKCGGATRLIVGQRIATIMDADKIIVLEEGEMAGMGTHKELLKDCEVYKEIALSQLSKEELAV